MFSCLTNQYNFRAEQTVCSNLIGGVTPYMTFYSPLQVVNVTFLHWVTKLATFAIQASTHGRQLLNWVFIYLEDITPTLWYLYIWKDGEFSKWLLLPWDQRSFQELMLKTLHRSINTVDKLISSRWDQLTKLISLQTNYNKLLILRWWQL